MDKLDYRILGILKENGRVTASDISKEIHLSVSAVLERIKKMEESGIIKGYTVMVDSKALGNDVTAPHGDQSGASAAFMMPLQRSSRIILISWTATI